jgi:polyisoprenoid-binding protein YceI
MVRRILSITVCALVLAPALALAADFPLTGSNTTIKFVGTKPGGKHDGGFKSVKGTASVTGADAATLKISLDIETDSLYSDNEKLTAHLKSPDFFGVKSNPKVKFVTTKVEKADAGYIITGELTLLGKTKSVSFPATIAVKGDSLNVTANFSIDRTQWGMTYGKGKVDDMVKLSVSVNAKN